MRRYVKAFRAAAVVGSAAVMLAACGGGSKGSGGTGTSNSPGSTGASGYNAAFDHVVNPSTKTGGTLNLVATSDCDSWDPQRTYYGWCWNMQRLFTRSLLGYSVVNGTKFTLAPDLATDMGTHNADFTQWKFTLKSGLKFSNGAAITPMDVKYGVERLFATDVINGGPSSYFLNSIKHPADYKGPYKSGDLTSIETSGSDITFNLSSGYAQFPSLMAMSASAPVPYKTEGGPGFVGATYTKHPVSSGPYMIQSYTPNTSITFVKNPNWNQSTDTIHKPLVDKVVLTIDSNPTDADAKLKAGEVQGNASDPGVTAGFQTQILTQPSLKANADDPVSASTRYLSVMQSVITDVNCRQAIFYATNKAAVLQAYGGAVAGQIAGSMTPPGILGNDPNANPYPVGSDNTGDLTKAKAALQACGKPNGFSTKFAYATPSTKAKQVFVAEQAALARVGINITPATQDSSNYYSTFIGSPANIKNQGIGIALAGWGADFPDPVGFWQAIANGNAIVPTGNSNYPSLNDPVVNQILDNGPLGKSSESDWKNLDAQIMKDAVYLPLYWEKSLYYRDPKMTNVTCDNALAFGIYDWVNAGVTS